MAEFKIITDSTADLPEEYLKEHDIDCMNLCYMIGGETYGGETGKELPWKEFYALMRNGEMPTTAQVNPEEAKEQFKKSIEAGSKKILYLAFSSGLSGTYNSVRIAAEEIMEEYPDCQIIVIDTLCASLGEGLLVYYAVKMQNEGKSFEEVAKWVEEHVQNFVHVFTVDDLNHLHRGGRVSKAVAIIGTLAGIKPVLHVDEEGHLVPQSNVRGRKKSLLKLVDNMEKQMGSYTGKNDIVFISHGDALEDAEFVRDEVKRRFGIEKFIINRVGPTIGAHSGPGTIALFFMGDIR
ncbi:MAG: DegV family protein [Lachnospiraceae bacterium]|nr:DegV family protein [Lachnospiraceae bacterium]